MASSSTQPPIPFALRVDGDDYAGVSAWLASLGSGAYFGVRETAGEDGANVHMHFIFFSSKRIQTLRQSFVRKFPELSGNKSYSLTVVEDEEKYLRYLCKGADADTAPEVIARQGIEYTDEWVSAQHSSYWEVSEQIAAARAARKRPLFEQVYDECVRERVPWSDDKEIAKKYIKACADAHKAINLFAVRSSVNLLKVKLCPDDRALDQLAENVASRQ